VSLPKTNARRSEWEVVDRCLALLLRLMKGPAASEELLEIVYEKTHQNGEDLTRSKALRRFEEDRARLKEHFRCEIDYDRSDNLYSLLDIGRPLFDLPSDALHGLAFLKSTFSNPAAPKSSEVKILLDRVTAILPKKTQRALLEPGMLEFDLRQRDDDTILEDVWDAVETACGASRQLEFDYQSPKRTDGDLVHHLVEPYRYYFDPTRCHLYLECYWIHSYSHTGGHREQHKMNSFRLGRMQNPKVLPSHFLKRRIPQEELTYELAADIARLGVTKHFKDMQIINHEDGSVTVHAMSSNLFFDLRTLLHYGPNCRVIGGHKAVTEMHTLVNAMYGLYGKE